MEVFPIASRKVRLSYLFAWRARLQEIETKRLIHRKLLCNAPID
jgi:hypothetical protein